MKCRKNVKKLTPSEKTKFISAILALKAQDSVIHPGSQSRYDDFVETHLNAMYDFSINNDRPLSWGHGNSVFLPWHRELLYQFEKLLQSVDPSVTIPYWDWTRAQALGETGFPFTYDFIGPDGTDTSADLVLKEPGAPSPYPYPFDPETWSTNLTVFDPMDSLTTFQREFGEFDIQGTFADAPNLPENDTVVTGTGTTFRAAIDSANSYLILRERSEDLHNLVHRWVGGNMLRRTSPNDPVFFLHHAQIDRMWSIWQKKVPAGQALYEESITDPGHKLNDAMIYNDANDAPFTTGATPAQMINGHTMHGDGVWYDSDVPEIDNPSPTLDFINIPEGLTSFKAVKFKIKGCRPVKFRITGDPTGQFGITPMGHDFIANPIEADDFYYGFVWVQVVSIAGNIPNSSFSIHAYFNDEEGYYAATEGGEVALGDYIITLTATSIARESNSITLVLDRSGSMMAPAGGSSTRSQLLGNAIEVFRTLMLPNDEVAVITFDDIVSADIPMQAVSGAPSFGTVDITPRNETWIGGGIQEGAVQLASATHVNKSMIVLTDGNENVHPYIGELPAGTITNRTYAIGFGLPGEVSDAALNQITSNTNGDLIITGNMPGEEQRFNLTKYFVQILAGVTNSQVILDPKGKLFYGSKDIIPFKITEADVYVDAIALCPIPRYLEFVLRMPGGKLIKPTSVEPNVQYISGRQVICYRMVLPAIASDTGGSHAGTWNAILNLKGKADITKMLGNKRFAENTISPQVNAYLPYSFLVHATSNLQFNAWRTQGSFVPGASVTLYATLKEYDVPVLNKGSIYAEITRPDDSTFIISLKQDENGIISGKFNTIMPGVYVCRVIAEGNTSKGFPYTREKTLTAGVYYGKYDPVPQPNPGDLLCDLLHCMLEEHQVFSPAAYKRFAASGIDLKEFAKCVDEVCPEHEKEFTPGIQKRLGRITRKNTQTIKQVRLNTTKSPKPVKVKKGKIIKHTEHLEMKEMFHTMFMPLELGKDTPKTNKRTSKTTTAKGEHRPGHTKHTMFMPLNLSNGKKKKNRRK